MGEGRAGRLQLVPGGRRAQTATEPPRTHRCTSCPPPRLIHSSLLHSFHTWPLGTGPGDAEEHPEEEGVNGQVMAGAPSLEGELGQPVTVVPRLQG